MSRLREQPGAIVAPPTIMAGEIETELQVKLSAFITAVAGENLSGNRVVRINGADAFLADKDAVEASHAIGLTTGAALISTSTTIQTDGVMTEGSWSWAVGPVWLGAAGLPTQTPPTTGALVRIGTAIAPTKLVILPVFLAKL